MTISKDDCFQVYLRRPPNSCFFENYFKIGLSSWQGGMDIEPVFNEHKAIDYLCIFK